jgi:nitrogen fixation NifU-like protein
MSSSVASSMPTSTSMGPDPTNRLDDLYREVILDHYREPCGRDPIEASTHAAEGFNPVCGDECEISLRLDGDDLRAIHVGGRGCSISVASGSIMAELVAKRPMSEVRRLVQIFRDLLHGETISDELDIGDLEVLGGLKDFPVRVKCAMLAWTTLESAVAGGCHKATTEGTIDDMEGKRS